MFPTVKGSWFLADLLEAFAVIADYEDANSEDSDDDQWLMDEQEDPLDELSQGALMVQRLKGCITHTDSHGAGIGRQLVSPSAGVLAEH